MKNIQDESTYKQTIRMKIIKQTESKRRDWDERKEHYMRQQK